MRLNDLKPAAGSRFASQRVGRGYGSNRGSTAGRGNKGQKSRSGGYHKVGFEGGQMPMQRRMPKFGFASTTAKFSDEVRTGDLAKCGTEIVDLPALRDAKLIGHRIKKVKVIASGELTKEVTVQGLAVTKGANAIIKAAGGQVE